MSRSRSIPSLDGMRAFSVLLVMVGHESWALIDRLPAGMGRNGALGVNIFFVISGFLITHLMLSEIDKAERLDLKAFYLRRAFRIFPPFYVYIAVIAVLSAIHIYPVHWGYFLGAATYTLNYASRNMPWVLGHSWSLCIEEQFYLLWPACVALVPRRICLRIAGAIILLSPLSRVATYYLDKNSLSSIMYMSHTRADALMVGCFLALALSMKRYTRTLHILKQPAVAAIAAAIVFLGSHYYPNWFRVSFGYSIDALCCGALLLYAISHEHSVAGKVLNNRWVKHFGVISYSLYLWQQLFTGPNTRMVPWNLLCVVACAEASYWLVERPSFKLRDRFLKRKESVFTNADVHVVQEIDAL